MSHISERPVWEEPVYRIQVSDPISGGEDGIVNIQPGQIANRTTWLLDALSRQHSEEGHLVFSEQIAPDAHISYSKTQLDVPLEAVSDAISHAQAAIASLAAQSSDLIGEDGLLVEAVSRALRLVWQSGGLEFDWELFSGTLTAVQPGRAHVISTVAGDDTIIVDSTRGLQAGAYMLLYDAQGATHPETVKIREILSDKRLLATADVTQSITDGFLSGSTFDDAEKPARAAPGAVYLTHVSRALEDTPYGTLVIRRDDGQGTLSVEARFDGSDTWTPVAVQENKPVEGGTLYDEYYVLQGGSGVQVRVTSSGSAAVNVSHIVMFAFARNTAVEPLKKPAVTDPAYGDELYRNNLHFGCTPMMSAYRDRPVKAEFALIPEDTSLQTYTFEAFPPEGGGSYAFEPLEEISTVDVPAGPYRVRVRHYSDMGDVSAWSDPVSVFIREPIGYFSFVGADYGSGFEDEDFNSLQIDEVRFGFDGSAGSAGFGEALFTLE